MFSNLEIMQYQYWVFNSQKRNSSVSVFQYWLLAGYWYCMISKLLNTLAIWVGKFWWREFCFVWPNCLFNSQKRNVSVAVFQYWLLHCTG
jgi:hypothetical protein